MSSSRPHLSSADRLRLLRLHGALCHACGGTIHAERERWEIDHVVSRGIGGSRADTDANMRPAHVACHKVKTAGDAGDLARAKRREARFFGAYRPKQVFPGSRADHLRKRMDGRVERRLVEARV